MEAEDAMSESVLQCLPLQKASSAIRAYCSSVKFDTLVAVFLELFMLLRLVIFDDVCF
jgi:hypothetical protein